jgi:large subunit ribosomal protein L4
MSSPEGEAVVMATIDVFDLKNEVVGSVDLADDVFGAEVNENLIYESVRHYRAGLRGGNAKTKTPP